MKEERGGQKEDEGKKIGKEEGRKEKAKGGRNKMRDFKKEERKDRG